VQQGLLSLHVGKSDRLVAKGVVSIGMEKNDDMFRQLKNSVPYEFKRMTFNKS